MAENGRYYDWNRTLSYNATINMVLSPRGFGKTYGLRKHFVKDFLAGKGRFAVIVRHTESLKGEKGIQHGFFDKLQLNNEFPNHIFKVDGTTAYIARKPASDDVKPKWELIGYFVALTEMQDSKERTFVDVKNALFDEFIIDKRTRKRYLPDEFSLFVHTLDSLARQEVDDTGHAIANKMHVYLLGNACDLTNPYFIRWGINKQPNEGYSWYDGKFVLLHYAKDAAYQAGKRDTIVGRLVAGTKEESLLIDNDFKIADSYNIAKKSSAAQFQYGIIYAGQEFGVWMDAGIGLIFVNDRIPKNSGSPVMALTREDNTANYLQVRRGEKALKMLMDMYYADVLRFSTVGVREQFLTAMEMFGIH